MQLWAPTPAACAGGSGGGGGGQMFGGMGAFLNSLFQSEHFAFAQAGAYNVLLLFTVNGGKMGEMAGGGGMGLNGGGYAEILFPG